MKEQIKPFVRTALYYETDQMGIIHHSNYIRWFEEARSDYLNQIGFPYKNFEERGILIPVLSVECEYKHSVVYDETVIIEVKFTSFTGVKFEVEYKVYDETRSHLKATGHSKHGIVDRNMYPFRMKKEYPELYDMLKQLSK